MKKPGFIWGNVLLFSVTGFITLAITPYYALTHGFDIYQILAALAGIVFCELSITAGYHRLWSHRTYEAHPLLRIIFALGGAFAVQNSALHWSADHRRHHRHVDDNDKDPYSAGRGFWYSHLGWMLREYNKERYHDYSNVLDLQKDPIVMWQHRHYLALTLTTNFGIPLLLGFIHGDMIGTLILVGVVRLVLSHHMTFFINSLAHIWGKQPYSDKNTARDNGLLAFLTMGEGYHNYHHAFQNDYRNGIRWWQFDPTKWFIHSLNWFGFTRNLRRASEERVEKAHARMLLTTTTAKLAHLPNSEALRQGLHQEYDALLYKMTEFYATQKQWLRIKRESVAASYERMDILHKYKELKARFAEQKKYWLMLNAQLT